MTLKELNDKRLSLVTDARKISDFAAGEKREMNNEESEKFDRLMAEHDALDAQRDELIKGEKRAEWLKKQQEPEGRRSSPVAPGEIPNPAKLSDGEKREISWGEKYNSPRSIFLDGATGKPEYRADYQQWLAYGRESQLLGETRALQSDSDTLGGYLQAPVQMVAQLIKFVDNAVIVRQKASVFQAQGARSLGVPSLDTDIDDADWTSELGTGNEDSAMAFGKRDLAPKPLAKRIKVSNTLLRVAVIGAETLVMQRLAYKHAVAQEKAFMTGTGAGQPLGLFTATDLGIGTARDVSTGNTTTSITVDGLIEAKFAVKPQYQATGEWIFHRDAVKQIRKLKDGNGQYLWAAGLNGQPNTILDRPYTSSEYAPNTFTTGLYVGLFGDLSNYWIADNLNLTIQRLVELYAATNQTGFIGRVETDGMPVLAEAFSRVKLA